MTDNHRTNQFHGDSQNDGDISDFTEPLRGLVARLGIPPDDVIESWRITSPETLPQDFLDWDLDRLRVTSSATLIRLGLPGSEPQSSSQTYASHAHPDHAHNDVDASRPAERTPLASVTLNSDNPLAGSQTESKTGTSKTNSQKFSSRSQAFMLLTLAAAIFGIVYWAIRPSNETTVVSQSTNPSPQPNVFSPGPSSFDSRPNTSDRDTRTLGTSTTRPSTEPLEALSLIESADDTAIAEPQASTASTMLIDPAKFSLDGLIPPMQSAPQPNTDPSTSSATDEETNPLLRTPSLVATAIAQNESAASAAPKSMGEVLATGDDAPPSEKPQPVRDSDASASLTESNATIVADPLPLTITTSDQQPTWNLKQPIPGSGVRLTLTFDLPEGVNEGWIEPLDETSPRRTRAVAIITPENEESVAVGIRLDVRCNAKLSIRMRFAARLDPSLPWQMISRDSLLRSIDYVGSQSTFANTQLAQIESAYSKADTYEKRSIRDQRDAARTQVEQFKLVLKRLSELRELADRLETDGRLLIKLTAELPNGPQTLLETVAEVPEAQPTRDSI